MKCLKKQILAPLSFLLLCSITYADGFIEHVVFDDYGNAVSIAAADLDADGDIDMVASSFSSHYLAWMENDGFQNFTKHIIAEDLTNAFVVDIAQIDDDDDFDIVCAVKGDDLILWFSNDGAGNFTKDTVATDWESASFVMARDHLRKVNLDMDGDGDTDILATSNSPGDKVSWFENDGEENFTEHVVKENWIWARYSTACDIDKDGDVDIIATARNGESSIAKGDIIWFVNDGFQNFSEDTIVYNWGEPSSVQAADLDGDGDLDLGATFVDAQKVTWIENIDNSFDSIHTIRDNFNGAFSVAIEDYNDDGILDIAAEAWIGQEASVFYNNGDRTFVEEMFCNDNWELIKIFPADLDLDGDIDILGAVAAAKDVRWWENTLYEVKFGYAPQSGHAPLTVEFSDSSHLSLPINAWSWDFNNDGTFNSHVNETSWIYGEPGVYSVRLLVETDSLNNQILLNNCISVFDGFSANEFYGQTSSAVCNSELGLNSSFTFEAWVKPNSFGRLGCGRILDKDKIKIFSYSDGFESNHDSCLVVSLKHEDGTTSKFSTLTNTINLNEWQHIAVSYNTANSEAKIYINGEFQEIDYMVEPNGNIAENQNNPLCLGNSFAGNYHFDGIIDEVRLWDVDLSEYAIANNFESLINPLQNNLTGYWRMEEGNGETLYDLTDNENNIEITNVNWIQGKSLEPVGIDNKINRNGDFDVKSFPNPFSYETEIEIAIETDVVLIDIYDAYGKLIDHFTDFNNSINGLYSFTWKPNSNDNGIYFCHIVAGGSNRIIKLIKVS